MLLKLQVFHIVEGIREKYFDLVEDQCNVNISTLSISNKFKLSGNVMKSTE